MEKPETVKSKGILILVRSPLDASRIVLLKKLLQNPENTAVFLYHSIMGEPFGGKNIYRMNEKNADQNGGVFSWKELYALIRKHPRILTLS